MSGCCCTGACRITGRCSTIPLSDWPAVKQAIRELNEAKEYEEYVRSLKKLAQINKERDVETKKEEEKKRERFRQLFEKTERDMKNWPEWKRNITLLETSSTDKYKKEKDMKEDRYEFPLKEWEYTTEPEPFELPAPTKLILTRKKPKVKVEYVVRRESRYEPYGAYYEIQFRVTGWDFEETFEYVNRKGSLRTTFLDRTEACSYCVPGVDGEHVLYIGRDALDSGNVDGSSRKNYSRPVWIPQSVFEELPKAIIALESKANGGEG